MFHISCPVAPTSILRRFTCSPAGSHAGSAAGSGRSRRGSRPRSPAGLRSGQVGEFCCWKQSALIPSCVFITLTLTAAGSRSADRKRAPHAVQTRDIISPTNATSDTLWLQTPRCWSFTLCSSSPASSDLGVGQQGALHIRSNVYNQLNLL